MRKKMRKIITIPGIALVTTILLISGSALGGWNYGDHVEAYYQCTNPNNIIGTPNGENATIGVDTPLYRLGWIVVDLGEKKEMGPDQNFTVFASSRVEEQYNVSIGENLDFNNFTYIGGGLDTQNYVFKTPWVVGKKWRYIRIDGGNGSYDLDSHWGPEIDAVGWYQP